MIAFVLKSGLSMVVLYGLYWFFLRKEKIFVFNRFFLLSAVVFSLVLPFISIPVPTLKSDNPRGITSVLNSGIPEIIPDIITRTENIPQQSAETFYRFNILQALILFYSAVALILLIRFLRNIFFILRQKRSAEYTIWNGQKLVLVRRRVNPFCFFKTIFVNKEDFLDKKISDEMIVHEMEHRNQLHSADILFIEIIRIAYWFNPVLIMYNNAIRINHEFLADEGALKKSDLKKYTDRLLDFITYKTGISLMSGFNHSDTKKRLLMLTRAGAGTTNTVTRIILTLSLAMILMIFMSFKNQETTTSSYHYENQVAASITPDMNDNPQGDIETSDNEGKGNSGIIEVTKKTTGAESSEIQSVKSDQDAVISLVAMNVLYRGIPNPVEIAVPGIPGNRVTVEMTNGTIKRSAKGWEIVPGPEKQSILTVYVDNKKVSEKQFRVKNIPVPKAVFHGQTTGSISRSAALDTDVLEAEIVDFDFDVTFKITGFTFFLNTDSADIEIIVYDNKLTDEMKSYFKKSREIIFKDIRAVGPGGMTYDLNPVILKSY